MPAAPWSAWGFVLASAVFVVNGFAEKAATLAAFLTAVVAGAVLYGWRIRGTKARPAS